MSVENKKHQLRSMLAGKSTAELEELLALEATDLDAVGENAEYISTILEVIAERESTPEQDEAMTEKAWEDFQEYYDLRKQEEQKTDTDGEPPPDHRPKTEYRQQNPGSTRVLRYVLIAAVLTALLGNTVFGWNLFRAVARWTEETFCFLAGREPEDPEQGVMHPLQRSVEAKTETPAVPKWVPEGTEENGWPSKNERTDRFIVRASYTVGTREFSVQITVHDAPPESYDVLYQKNTALEEAYSSGGIIHYIMGNTETISAMWINNCVEGYIQGELTVEELRQMIDSIYEE